MSWRQPTAAESLARLARPRTHSEGRGALAWHGKAGSRRNLGEILWNATNAVYCWGAPLTLGGSSLWDRGCLGWVLEPTGLGVTLSRDKGIGTISPLSLPQAGSGQAVCVWGQGSDIGWVRGQTPSGGSDASSLGWGCPSWSPAWRRARRARRSPPRSRLGCEAPQ